MSLAPRSEPARPTPGRRVLALTATTLATALVLAGCSGGSEDPQDPATPSETPSTSPSPVEDDGITPAGSQLAFGDTATVDYEIKGKSTELDLTVNSAVQGALKDFSGFDTKDPLIRKANYYYVRVTVKNTGKKRFGNAEVPLWGISGEDTLLPPVKFTSAFDKCPTETLPKKFDKGDQFKTCLVFLSPKKGSLEGVSYRPTEQFTPIEWHGKVKMLAKKKTKKNKG